ncbi:MAG: heme exporter protein CcmB [Armatimonadetes bacterium]|nr:heme exporter protein CcmB [Armatimonadota bacterium]
MSSSWLDQAVAVFQKEVRTEFRSKHGLFTAGMFGVLTVLTMVFSTYIDKPSPSLAAGMLVVALVFAAVSTLPRTMIIEDEQGTFELLQLLSDPSAAFFGKAVFNALHMLIASLLLGGVFVAMVDIPVVKGTVFVLGLALLALALAGGTSFCGGLVLGAANRWILAGLVSLPLLVPVVFLGVGALQAGLGSGLDQQGNQSLVALAGYALVTLAAGPILIGQVWRND